MRRHQGVIGVSSDGSSNSSTIRKRQPSKKTLNRGAKKTICILGAATISLLFLIGVHLFLFRVLLLNEEQIINEFSSVQTKRQVTPLRQIDYEVYTIRINSWKRVDQLEASIHHHSTCPGVVQIQVVWCMDQGSPPAFLLEYPKVIVERHDINSLQERFHILEEAPPTYGILSMDDDVLRPCAAIDAGFFKWTRNPDRMVGFDGRSHSISSNKKWEYAFLSETERTNRYSLTLPRYSFIHVDYLNWYMDLLPRPIFDHVASNFNCEDIAMSFFVSSMTDGKPPLLADKWASVGTQIKLYSSKGGISDQVDHKSLRDKCVDEFAEQLNLKDKLQYGTYLGQGFFDCGDLNFNKDVIHSPRQEEFEAMRNSWSKMSNDKVIELMVQMKKDAMHYAYVKGLIVDSEPWKKRWNLKSSSKKKKKKKH
jgi:glucuronyl/N-acetylglucosaminyl transferase EXT2